jgi:hypothetical protein
MVIELNENQKEVVIEALNQYIVLFCAGELDVPESDIDTCEDVIEMITNSK